MSPGEEQKKGEEVRYDFERPQLRGHLYSSQGRPRLVWNEVKPASSKEIMAPATSTRNCNRPPCCRGSGVEQTIADSVYKICTATRSQQVPKSTQLHQAERLVLF